jgi:hypothetical protein
MTDSVCKEGIEHENRPIARHWNLARRKRLALLLSYLLSLRRLKMTCGAVIACRCGGRSDERLELNVQRNDMEQQEYRFSNLRVMHRLLNNDKRLSVLTFFANWLTTDTEAKR